MPASLPRWGGLLSTLPYLPVSATYQTPPGLPFPQLSETWCCNCEGRHGLVCGYDPQFPPQIDGVLKVPFHIDAQSDQCDEAMLQFLSRGDLLFRGNPRSSAQSFGCCGGAPGLWRPRGSVDPRSHPLRPWRSSPGPWRVGPGIASLSAARSLVPLRKEGGGAGTSLLARWGR